MQQGIAIAFPIAFVTLLVATGNVVLALFAIMSVGGVVACTLGLAEVLGWKLGIGEAISGVMVIGLAVDYTIHFGHMCQSAPISLPPSKCPSLPANVPQNLAVQTSTPLTKT